MKICKDVMTTEPVCCFPNESVEIAAQLMKLEDVGCIPVVDNEENYKLVGILTDRDLAMEIVAAGRDASRVKVEEIMKNEPFACKDSDQLDKAIDGMANHQVRRIPIVDDDNRVVGIIAQGDVATRLHDPETTGQIVEKISQ